MDEGSSKTIQTGMSKELDYSSVLQVRLNTDPLMQQFRTYLTGKVQDFVYDEKGKGRVVEKQIAPPKANELGQQWILNYIGMIINPSTVQANFHKEEMFYWYVMQTRVDLAINLMKNQFVWQISDADYRPLIASVMAVVYPFMTRPLANKERESYGGMRVVESSSVEQRNKRFNLFNNRGGY